MFAWPPLALRSNTGTTRKRLRQSKPTEQQIQFRGSANKTTATTSHNNHINDDSSTNNHAKRQQQKQQQPQQTSLVQLLEPRPEPVLLKPPIPTSSLPYLFAAMPGADCAFADLSTPTVGDLPTVGYLSAPPTRLASGLLLKAYASQCAHRLWTTLAAKFLLRSRRSHFIQDATDLGLDRADWTDAWQETTAKTAEEDVDELLRRFN